jgi:cyclase
MEKKMFHKASPLIFERAAALRERMTGAENVLWEHLNNKRLGVKFRRQHPLANYIVDFYCHKFKLVIEVDGGIHENVKIKKHDVEREEHLKQMGLTIIRFTNNEVLYQIEKVLENIKSFIH